MNRLSKPLREFAKIGLLVGALVFAAVGIAQDSTPAESAGTTQILLSYSNLSPVHATSIVVSPDGIDRDIYVWAVSVKEPGGASGFHLDIGFDGSLVTAVDWVPYTAWLASGNPPRSPSCPSPTIEANRVYVDCVTIDHVPPFGVQGTGLLAKLTLDPGSTMGPNTMLDLTGSFLVDTPVDLDPGQMAGVTVLSSSLLFMGCADTNGDGTVDLLNDILGIIQHYSPSGAPPYDPAFDINDDGAIDLLLDILGAITQFQVPCV